MKTLRSISRKSAGRFVTTVTLAATLLAAASLAPEPADAAIGTHIPGVMQCEDPSGLDFTKRVIGFGPRVRAANVSTRVDYQFVAWRARPVYVNPYGLVFLAADWTDFTYAYAADTGFTGAYYYDIARRSPLAGNGYHWDVADNMPHYIQNELRFYEGSAWSTPRIHLSVDVYGYPAC